MESKNQDFSEVDEICYLYSVFPNSQLSEKAGRVGQSNSSVVEAANVSPPQIRKRHRRLRLLFEGDGEETVRILFFSILFFYFCC